MNKVIIKHTEKVEDNKTNTNLKRLNATFESNVEEDLSHAGVRGMKWGVRKKEDGGTNTSGFTLNKKTPVGKLVTAAKKVKDFYEKPDKDFAEATKGMSKVKAAAIYTALGPYWGAKAINSAKAKAATPEGKAKAAAKAAQKKADEKEFAESAARIKAKDAAKASAKAAKKKAFDEEYEKEIGEYAAQKAAKASAKAAEKSVIAERKALSKNRRTMSDESLNKVANRIQLEKKVKGLVDGDVAPGRNAAQNILGKVGNATLMAAAGAVGGAIVAKALHNKP